jgi:hypothetical protein
MVSGFIVVGTCWVIAMSLLFIAVSVYAISGGSSAWLHGCVSTLQRIAMCFFAGGIPLGVVVATFDILHH